MQHPQPVDGSRFWPFHLACTQEREARSRLVSIFAGIDMAGAVIAYVGNPAA